jgi:hypothetical protein
MERHLLYMTLQSTIKNIILATAATFAIICAEASPSVKNGFIVQKLSTDPAFVGNTSEDLLLHDGGDGSTYLYVEQQHGTILAIFDITNPEHMIFTESVRTEGHGGYEFVGALSAGVELIAFRNGSGTGMLDLHRAKSPRLTPVKGSSSPPTQILGAVGYLTLRQQAPGAAIELPRDLHLVETNQSGSHETTITGVTKQVRRADTGTIFVLTDSGITVIRRLDIERDYKLQLLLNKN